MVLIDETVVSVALPTIQRDLDMSQTGLQWVVNAYLLALAAFVAVGGRLAEMLGYARVFRAGVVLFLLSSAACGVAQSEAWLLSARAAQGIGAALMIPATGAIVISAFDVRERGRAMGIYAGISMIFLALGPAGRRAAHAGRHLAGRVLGQPPGGAGDAGARPRDAREGPAGPGRPHRLAGGVHAGPGAGGGRPRPDAGPDLGLDLGGNPRPALRRPGPRGGLPARRAPGARAADPARAVSQPQLQRGQRRARPGAVRAHRADRVRGDLRPGPARASGRSPRACRSCR